MSLAVHMMGLHDRLDARFFAHQRALLDRDFARAGRELAAYADLLALHVADEEDHVLPRYAAIGGDATDAPTRLFLGEHGRIREFVADFGVRVARLAEGPDDRLLLELLDRQATFKNLFLHHDLRERNALYPRLQAAMSAADERAVLAVLRLRP